MSLNSSYVGRLRSEKEMKNDLRKLDSVAFLTIDVKLDSSKAFWNEDFKININETDI